MYLKVVSFAFFISHAIIISLTLDKWTMPPSPLFLINFLMGETVYCNITCLCQYFQQAYPFIPQLFHQGAVMPLWESAVKRKYLHLNSHLPKSQQHLFLFSTVFVSYMTKWQTLSLLFCHSSASQVSLYQIICCLSMLSFL